jgi:hypothetical protein
MSCLYGGNTGVCSPRTRSGGFYQAIWARDASYILKDWLLSGNIEGALRQIYFICHWSLDLEVIRVPQSRILAMEFWDRDVDKEQI